MKKHLSTISLVVFVIFCHPAVPCEHMALATTVYQEDFSAVLLPPEWVTIAPEQWVQDGWLHAKDPEGGTRDSMALVNDGDPSWKDYTLHISVDPIEGTSPWTFSNVLLRKDGFVRGAERSDGSAYQLEIFNVLPGGGIGSGAPNRITLTRTKCTAVHVCPSTVLSTVNRQFTGVPIDVTVSLVGGKIKVSADGEQVMDVVDPAPLAFGGIGFRSLGVRGSI